jgi:hypothetical protein
MSASHTLLRTATSRREVNGGTRFSGYYLAAFGEIPSATLRRDRRNVAQPT